MIWWTKGKILPCAFFIFAFQFAGLMIRVEKCKEFITLFVINFYPNYLKSEQIGLKKKQRASLQNIGPSLVAVNGHVWDEIIFLARMNVTERLSGKD